LISDRDTRVGVCEKRYIFENESTDRLNPAERCPAYGAPEDIATSVREKQRRDDTETAELINRGIPSAPVTTGLDGGMNPTFLAKAR
jgi:murein L,D-transpeptidase YafK